MLSAADHINRVISRKHHAHVLIIVTLDHFRGEARRFGGGRVAQFVGIGLHNVIVLLTLLAHVAVRAHGETMQRGFALLRPFGQCLRE
ncbi:hypothetical protein D3C76_1617510 [compost metagenome]